MRFSRSVCFLLFVVLLFSAGCSSNNEGKLEDTRWTSQSVTVQGHYLPAGSLSLTFRKDGSLMYEAGPETFTGKYSLGMSDYVTFKLDRPLAGRKNHLEKVKIEENRLTLIDSDGTSLTFDRDY